MSDETETKGQDELVTIAVFPEPMEANMARSALQSAGISVFLQGETANSMIPVAFVSQLQVCAKDEAAARSLLDAMDEDPESLESVTAAEIAAEDAAKVSRPKAVVCLSGGMDSAVCATLAVRDYDSYGLHFSYGQRTQARELQAAREVAKALGLQELMELETDLFRRIGGSALVDLSIAMPDAAISEGSRQRQGNDIPVTYVPFRNAHFLSAAVSWAEVLGAKTVFIGAVQPDSSGYPDCRPAYYEAFNKLIQVGTKEGEIAVVTPLIALRKHEIVRLGVELGTPLRVTWSCYSGETEACGVCESCDLRLRAFAAAGVADEILYAPRGKERDYTNARQQLHGRAESKEGR